MEYKSNKIRNWRLRRHVKMLVGGATLVAMTAGFGLSTASGAATAAHVTKPVAGRPLPVANTNHKTFKIYMVAANNNPFWDQVKVGFNTAQKVLDSYGVKSTYIDAGASVTSQLIGTGIDTGISQGANAIAAQLPDNSICYYLKQAKSHHVVTAGVNGNVSCAQSSGALFFLGQNFIQAGKQDAQLMCKATANLASKSKPGKVGIATESFTFEALVQRTQGFVAGLKQYCPWVTPINAQGVNYASSSIALLTSDVQDFVASNSNLVGVYVTGGNPDAAAREIGALHKKNSVKVVGFDLTSQVIAQIQNGNMYGTVTQDPFGQGYNTMIDLYNYLETGKKPSSSYIIATKDVVVTKSNLKQAVAAQAAGN
jgi:ribose transport system substrate-binding protein